MAKAIIEQAMEKGLILLSCGTQGNVLRFLFPLTIQGAVFAEGLDILSMVFRNVSASHE